MEKLGIRGFKAERFLSAFSFLRVGRSMIKKLVVCAAIVSMIFCASCGTKTPEYLEVEVYPTADYWTTMDLSETLFPTKEACEELAEQYLQDAAKLLHMEGWWMDINPDATKLELDIQIGSSA